MKTRIKLASRTIFYDSHTICHPWPELGFSGDNRVTEFRQRCKGLGISGISLHSYRLAWAERAKSCGYPERYAIAALGHNSKAVHRAYAKRAAVEVPSLEEFEARARSTKAA